MNKIQKLIKIREDLSSIQDKEKYAYVIVRLEETEKGINVDLDHVEFSTVVRCEHIGIYQLNAIKENIENKIKTYLYTTLDDVVNNLRDTYSFCDEPKQYSLNLHLMTGSREEIDPFSVYVANSLEEAIIMEYECIEVDNSRDQRNDEIYCRVSPVDTKEEFMNWLDKLNKKTLYE